MHNLFIKTIIRILIFICQAGVLLASYLIKGLTWAEKQLTFQLDQAFVEPAKSKDRTKQTPPKKKRRRHKTIQTQ